MKHFDFDVIVVGGGHAGCEAAHAAARMRASVCLITLKADAIGVMSCNPAIGGLGKGHLVREIDALDGIMGTVADAAGIQFRLLNRKKGPAVQGPRAQADRKIYRETMQALLVNTRGLSVLEGEVVDFVMQGDVLGGVVLGDGSTLTSPTVVLTTGTFLGGLIHIGDRRIPAGRMGESPSVKLAERLRALDLSLGRLKTGTPPRLNGRTIAWDKLDRQPGDSDPVMFSFLSKGPRARQISCGITHTNSKTHEIIRRNLTQSAMYGGAIDGVGPRYCPSIEDKIVRFADKDSHQVFLEPESLSDDVIYPNGISTSLPEGVQLDYVRSIVGLETVEILQPGYAIEYDYVDPRALTSSLAVKKLPGLFFAGQLNGTTGYEEAAAQGLVAGLNAACQALKKPPVVFNRTDSYIGVMIDDLISRGVTEPYRMFTSRAEYRLSLRADNADQRLTPVGIEVGCVLDDRKNAFHDKMERLDRVRTVARETMLTTDEISGLGANLRADGQKKSVYQALSLVGMNVRKAASLVSELSAFDREDVEQVACEAVYANYILRQEVGINKLKRDENVAIPQDFDYSKISGLSNELVSKLNVRRPESMAAAAKIEGMTPAGLMLILSRLGRTETKKRA